MVTRASSNKTEIFQRGPATPIINRQKRVLPLKEDTSIIPFKDKRWDYDSDDADPHVFSVDQKSLLSWEKV